MVRAVLWVSLSVAMGCGHGKNRPDPPPKPMEPVVDVPAEPAPAPPPSTPEKVEMPARPIIALPRPPFRRVVGKAFIEDETRRIPTLRVLKQSKNQITDLDAWYQNNALQARSQSIDEGQSETLAQRGIPREVAGAKAVRLIQHDDHQIVFYDAPEQRGRYLIVQRGEELFGPFDFATYRDPPKSTDEFTAMETLWAVAREGVLLVSHAHPTYAKSSHGQNAYVTALSLSDGALRWRSQALVSNSRECLLLETALICGYGFTDESDHVMVLRASDGEVVQRLSVESGPEQIVLKDKEIYVRTYDTDYVLGYR